MTSRYTRHCKLALAIYCASMTICAQASVEQLRWYSQISAEELQTAETLAEAAGAEADAGKLKELLGIDPEQAKDGYLQILVKGIQSMKAGDFIKAAAHLEEAIELDSRHHSAWLHLIESYRMQKDNEKLLTATDRYLAAFPKDERVRRTVGKMWMQLGEWERLKPLRKAYVESTDCCEDISGELNSMKDEPFLSLIMVERRLAEDPLNPEALLQMGMVLCRFGKCDEGISYFEKRLDQQPDDLRTVMLIARGAKIINDVERGFKAAERADVLLQSADLPPPAHAHLRKELDELLLYFLEQGATGE